MTNSTLKKTSLYRQHKKLGAKIVDFGGWALPVNYGSQIDEHNAVRSDCGIFDVSHMTVSDITGKDTLPYLSNLLANDIEKIAGIEGKALYSCMLNEQGGVIDDLIVYYINDQHCRLVTNAGTNEKDMTWLSKQAESFKVVITEQPKLALIAVQGPRAIEHCNKLLDADIGHAIDQLERFQGIFIDDDATTFVARTGYTGEDGVEFIISAALANSLWETFVQGGIQPCGLGARDTLRLEAGMSLYGNDLDENHTPLESGLAWTVSISRQRDFIGKSALTDSSKEKMVGLILLDRGVLRGHQTVHMDDALNDSLIGKGVGEITSGTFSPTLEKSIAIARVNTSANLKIGQTVQISMRKKLLDAVIVKYPFVKNGKTTN